MPGYFEDNLEQLKSFKQLFAKLRDYAEGDTWSAGVRLTRNAKFLVDASNPDEIHVRIKNPGEVVSPNVIFYLLDSDWSCSVEDENDPCRRTVAAAMALNNGVGLVEENEGSAPGFIRYELFQRQGLLGVKRHMQRGESREELKRPLRDLAAGSESGRIKGGPIAIAQEDFSVDSALSGGGKKLDDMGEIIIAPERMSAVIKALSQLPNLKFENREIVATFGLPEAKIEVYNSAELYILEIIHRYEIEREFKNGAILVDGTLYPSLGVSLGSNLNSLLLPPKNRFSDSELSRLTNDILPELRRYLEVDESEVRYPHIVETEPEIDIVMEQDESGLRVYPRITYGRPIIAESDGRQLKVFAKKTIVERNLFMERQLATKLRQELNLQLGREVLFRGKDAVNFTKKAATWKTSGRGEDEFALVGELRAEIVSDNTDFDLLFKVSGKQAARTDVFAAWERKEPYVKLLDGGWAVLPTDWFEKYGKKVKDLILAQNESGEIPSYLKPTLLELIDETGGTASVDLKSFKDRLLQAREFSDFELPADLEADLRGYQREGVAWLSFLKSSGIGALLADDMGLGKTLQAICMIEASSLVVAPTSVLSSWKQQIRKFRPSLKVSIYHGPKRAIDKSADVILTSYAITRIDREILSEIDWSLVVIDEAQSIKNPNSQLAKAVYSLQSKFRICLSGTPVENQLSDLWSQFHFLNPKLLGSQDNFRKEFTRPINQGSEQAVAALKRRVRPFILRRLKSEVLKELPAKTESVLWTELSDAERKIYDSLYLSSKKEVLEKLDQKGGVFAALEVLLRLRQAACHSALLPKETAESSSKIETLLAMLKQSLASNHRALIFSQWTSFLDLVEPHLQANNIDFSRLDGSTRDRESVINNFQKPNGPSCMLLSLKAGGLGVTLTAADQIYLLDSWWNPAVEEQASDRAHRIGQENPVFVYRLLAKNTIEENVLALQDKKRDLADAILANSSAAAQLSKSDILALFE